MAVLRQPPRTPVKRVASGSLATPLSIQGHKKFDDSDVVVDDKLEDREPEEEEDRVSENESESDEAPEEESNSTAAEQLRKRAQELERSQTEELSKEKAKRRERDAWLKEQKQKAKSSLLPESIIEALQEEQARKESISATTSSKPSQHIKLDALNTQKLSKKKSLYKKGPVLVKVLQAAKKLAPQAESVVNQTRDSFLNRKSIHRR